MGSSWWCSMLPHLPCRTVLSALHHCAHHDDRKTQHLYCHDAGMPPAPGAEPRTPRTATVEISISPFRIYGEKADEDNAPERPPNRQQQVMHEEMMAHPVLVRKWPTATCWLIP